MEHNLTVNLLIRRELHYLGIGYLLGDMMVKTDPHVMMGNRFWTIRSYTRLRPSETHVQLGNLGIK